MFKWKCSKPCPSIFDEGNLPIIVRVSNPKTFSMKFLAGLSPILMKMLANCMNWWASRWWKDHRIWWFFMDLPELVRMKWSPYLVRTHVTILSLLVSQRIGRIQFGHVKRGKWMMTIKTEFKPVLKSCSLLLLPIVRDGDDQVELAFLIIHPLLPEEE